MSRLLSLVGAAAILFLYGCGGKEGGGAAPAKGQPVSDLVSEVTHVETRADRAPNFSWRAASGNEMNLDSLRGQVVFLNFWATWCGPCQKELPDLAELSRTYANRRVTFIGASMDRGPNSMDDVRSFVQKAGLPYQNVIASDDMAEAFGNVRLLPTSFLIDGDGKISQTFIGIRSKDFYANSIASLLK